MSFKRAATELLLDNERCFNKIILFYILFHILFYIYLCKYYFNVIYKYKLQKYVQFKMSAHNNI